jgi:hypothetical protein
MSENVSIREIAWRQYNAGRPASFFIKIVDIILFSSELDLVKPRCGVFDLKCSVLSPSLSSF